MVKMSKQMKEYFEQLQRQVDQAYDIANEARKKGLDPELSIESPQAKDLAGRVEKLVGPEGVANEILELKSEGKSDDEIVFRIVSDILEKKIGNIEKLDDRVERAIRVGLAIKTMGVVSAPLEGISKIKIRNDSQGNKYLSLYFAGPIRAAGGTTAALCVLIADYVREKSDIPKYKATEAEIGRYVEEVKLYGRSGHLQYPSSNDELRFAVDHLPVEINGDSTEQEEVSAFRNLPRVETNNIRGGACLVLNDGILLKAPKLLKIAKNMNLMGWNWLKELKNISHKEKKSPQTATKDDSCKKELVKVAPNFKYVADIIAGRPVFSFPSRKGGHRIRYGRSRNTGLAAAGFHPSTMALFDDFVAIGTQLRIERPGKSASICPVSVIEPPIVKLKNGDVKKINNPRKAKKIFSEVEEILFLGDILFGAGEFVENNHKFIPSGYVEEWWALELENALKQKEEVNKKQESYVKDPFHNIPTAQEAILISKEHKIPLHPAYLDFWGNISTKELKELRDCFLESFDPEKGNLSLSNKPKVKQILEKAFIQHQVRDGIIYFSKAMNMIYKEIFNLEENKIISPSEEETIFEYFSKFSLIEIKNKAPYYMGTRMGRPEKSERKTMKGIHTLFPLSDKVGNSRLVEKAIELGKVKIDVCRKKCPDCGKTTIFNKCEKCGAHTEVMKICENCNKLFDTYQDTCPQCNGYLNTSSDALFNIKNHVNSILNKYKVSMPNRFKGIFGLTSKYKIPEPVEKGLLRAKNNVLVYKTAEIRYDATDIPLTHFKPKEIGVSVEKLNDLGYTHDFQGRPLTSKSQILELKVQDILLSDDSAEYFVKVANFIDDELEYFYKMRPFYHVSRRKDLIGHLMVGLAPHTSAGVIGRVIGFSPARSIYAHPYWHAAKRRNCLHGSEEILIWDSKKKKLILKPIKKIIEDIIERGAKREIIDDYGTQKIENIYPEWKTVSIDPNKMKPIMQPIKHWIKGKSKSWIKVTTKTGRTITMTPHHSALVWNSEMKSLEKITASKLEVNDKIPILSKIKLPVNKPPSYVNILKELALKLPNTDKFKNFKHQLRLRKASNWIRSKLLSYAKEVPLLGVSQKEYQRIQQNIRRFYISLLPVQPFKEPLTTKWYKSIPLSHLEILQKEGVFQWDEIPHNAVLGMARDDHIVKPYIPFTTDLMRLLGYYIAEGYIRDENTCYQTNFSVPNPILRKHVRKLIIDLLDSQPYFKSDNGQLVHTGRIHAYLFAHSWKLGKGAYNKTIPNFIFNLPEEYRLEFISAFIDGDGSIPKTDKSILLYSVSKKLLYDFGVLLGTLGIMFRKRKPTPVGHYGKVILDRYKKLGKKPKDSIVHRIAIRGPDLRILEKLNIYNLEKRKNAERILKSGFTSKLIVKNQNNQYILLEKEENIVLDPIRKIENVSNFDGSYCFEVQTIRKSKLYNNLATSMCVTGNCDGDEDGLMLLLDPLLNFSRFYLPSKIGGRMDATLVIGTLLDPNEIDSEAHNVDTLFKYPLEFYEATERYAMPHEIEEILELVKSRLGSEGQYENIGFNIPTDDINAGPTMTAYKTYKSMDDKIEAQLHLAKIIKAVEAKKVAKKILSSHFNPDILGNLRKFAVQEFRCVKCNTKYRRPPISNNGKCPKCNNKVILTVNRGGIEKYIPRALKLCSEFNLDSYTQQRMSLIEEYVTSLTNNPKIKQQKLSDFF